MKKAPYLITYDIADNRIRRKVHRQLNACAFALQASVFVLYDYRQTVSDVVDGLLKVIEEQDRLLCVTLYKAGYCATATPAIPGLMLEHDEPYINQLLGYGNQDAPCIE